MHAHSLYALTWMIRLGIAIAVLVVPCIVWALWRVMCDNLDDFVAYRKKERML